MTHTDLILIISIITISSTLGVYATIRKINQYTRTPENLLERRGDIELATYSEPTQPLQTYYPESWLREVSSGPPSYYVESDPVIGYIPSQHVDIVYINSGLEQENIFIWIFLFINFTYIIYKIKTASTFNKKW